MPARRSKRIAHDYIGTQRLIPRVRLGVYDRAGVPDRIGESLVAIVGTFDIIETVIDDEIVQARLSYALPRKRSIGNRLGLAVNRCSVMRLSRAKPISQRAISRVGIRSGIDDPCLA